MQPHQHRFGINPLGKRFSVGGSIGAVGFHTAHLKKNTFSWDHTKAVALLLNKWRDERRRIRGDAGDPVRPTTIQINFNFAGLTHIDGNNLGESDIIALGSFEGGRFFS